MSLLKTFFRKKPKSFFEKIKSRFNQLSKKNKIIVIGSILLILVGTIGIIGWKYYSYKHQARKIYEVAIMVRDQYNPNPADDERSSLKAGDVLVIQKAGHTWSNSERVSYLILKMNLSDKEKMKLLQPVQRNMKKDDMSDAERKGIEEMKKKDKNFKEQPRMLTLKARQYRINLEKFKGFDAMQLLNGQPYMEKVYDWNIVERK